ncbi:MAG TPA: hypothetical protein ENH49_03750 [Candidatus Marinimicrobia bacterium]|nr:hypothetical protein [Candidatus Neomarinimicrobiota bacterium]
MKRVSIILIIAALFAVPLTAQMPEALKGYTVGLNVAMPVVGGEYYADSGMDPVFGIVIGTPYGLPLGPFNVGANIGIESANGLFGAFAYANASVYELPQGPISVFGGVGLLDGLGLIGGASLDYAIPNQPIVAKPYVRANISTGAANGNMTGWIQLGVMVSYSL